jgi:hypothetical protein
MSIARMAGCLWLGCLFTGCTVHTYSVHTSAEFGVGSASAWPDARTSHRGHGGYVGRDDHVSRDDRDRDHRDDREHDAKAGAVASVAKAKAKAKQREVNDEAKRKRDEAEAKKGKDTAAADARTRDDGLVLVDQQKRQRALSRQELATAAFKRQHAEDEAEERDKQARLAAMIEADKAQAGERNAKPDGADRLRQLMAR